MEHVPRRQAQFGLEEEDDPARAEEEPGHEPGDARDEAAAEGRWREHARNVAAPRRLAGADGRAVGTVLRREDADSRTGRRRHRRAEEAPRARPASAAVEAPRAAAAAHLDPVGLDAGARANLPPEDELAGAAPGLGDRERESERRELRAAGDVEEAALEPARLGLVLDEVVDQHVDPSCSVGAE